MTLTDTQRAELAAITHRDAITTEMWLLGPPASFTAQAARDRRFLLEVVRTLTAAAPREQRPTFSIWKCPICQQRHAQIGPCTP